MEANPENVQQAIRDLATIRRAVERTTDAVDPKVSLITIETNLILQLAAVVIAAVFFIIELTTGHKNTTMMLISANNPELRLIGIIEVALALILLCTTLYFIVYRAAKESSREFHDYLAKNFIYLKNMSFLSDLFVKFTIFSLLIAAGKPAWVSPVLLLFIGDYLIQGRFFTLPTKEGLLLGIFCVAAASLQMVNGSALLIWPLLAFIAAGVASILHNLQERKVISVDSE